MPLTMGATSKAILAHLPARRFNRVVDQWPEARSKAFRAELASVRRAGVCVSSGEIDANVVGVAAPILSKAPGMLASLSLVLPQNIADAAMVARVSAATMAGARRMRSTSSSRACRVSAFRGNPTGAAGAWSAPRGPGAC